MIPRLAQETGAQQELSLGVLCVAPPTPHHAHPPPSCLRALPLLVASLQVAWSARSAYPNLSQESMNHSLYHERDCRAARANES
jgi:hypothetical protein